VKQRQSALYRSLGSLRARCGTQGGYWMRSGVLMRADLGGVPSVFDRLHLPYSNQRHGRPPGAGVGTLPDRLTHAYVAGGSADVATRADALPPHSVAAYRSSAGRWGAHGGRGVAGAGARDSSRRFKTWAPSTCCTCAIQMRHATLSTRGRCSERWPGRSSTWSNNARCRMHHADKSVLTHPTNNNCHRGFTGPRL
jgi:hypothetical protein